MTPDQHETTPDEGVVSRRSWGMSGRRVLGLIALAVVLAMLLQAFVAQTFFVPSDSMAPTVRPGDRVVVTKVGADSVDRGDVIVFDGTRTFAPANRDPHESDGLIGRVLSGLSSAVGIDLGEQDYLKRVVAVGGDRVSCTPEGGLVVDGRAVAEPYLPEGTAACDSPFDLAVPTGRLFVLGDDRAHSLDSRAHLGAPGGGMIPLDDVIGHVSWRYWPLTDLGGL